MKRIALLLVCASFQSVTFAGGGVSIVQDKGKVVVKIDGKLFTEYHYTHVPKPVLYPVRWIDGTAMTRRFPMEPPKPGESNDHKHHRSLWWGHRHVKGGKSGGVHDFWGENSSSGKQVQTKVAIKDNSIHSWNKWVGNNGETVATDSRTITFYVGKADRMLDYSITIHASEGDLELQDDKDAGMSIRVPDTMCVSPHPTAKVKAQGHMLNSEGIKDAACWGKRAKWINYHGTVEGKTLGVTVLDHPDNPRHPSNWHARSYGLCAANVFGKRHFERLPDKSAGNMKLKRGESVTFNYRFVWHAGPADAKQIEEQWKKFAEIKF